MFSDVYDTVLTAALVDSSIAVGVISCVNEDGCASSYDWQFCLPELSQPCVEISVWFENVEDKNTERKAQ